MTLKCHLTFSLFCIINKIWIKIGFSIHFCIYCTSTVLPRWLQQHHFQSKLKWLCAQISKGLLMCAMYYFPSWDLMQGEAWFGSCSFSISRSVQSTRFLLEGWPSILRLWAPTTPTGNIDLKFNSNFKFIVKCFLIIFTWIIATHK